MTINTVKMTNGALAALLTELLTNPESGEVDSKDGFESLVDALTEVICDHCGGRITESAAYQGGDASPAFGDAYIVEIAPEESTVWARGMVHALHAQEETSPELPDPASFPDIVVGQQYQFFAEMQESELPAAERMRNYTGQMVTVILGPEFDEHDPETGTYFKVRAADGREFTAALEELNGWGKALGQYFWPDGTYGPIRDQRFLSNENSAG